MFITRFKQAAVGRGSRLINLARKIPPRVAGLMPDFRPPHLVILDDVFPNPLSAFRITEFEAYLDHFPGAEVFTASDRKGEFGRIYPEHVRSYFREHSQHAGRVRPMNWHRRVNASLFYCIFINNAVRFIDYIERNGAPFVFTLYPGGGFQLDDAASDRKLSRVFSSPRFSRVIVTQPITRDYLLRKGFCGEQQIEMVYGVVAPPAPEPLPKRLFERDKPTLDICFIAHKYMAGGIDKGFDTFVRVARELAAKREDVRFHVVGGFTGADLEIPELNKRIRFHGPQGRAFFPEFFRDMDLVLSPNVPFKLGPGAFDGFPTGCCVDAALAGTAVFCTDELKQNGPFKAGEEIIVVPADAHEICRRIEAYFADYPRLLALSKKGREAFTRVYSADAQIAPRMSVLEAALGAANHTPVDLSPRPMESSSSIP